MGAAQRRVGLEDVCDVGAGRLPCCAAMLSPAR